MVTPTFKTKLLVTASDFISSVPTVIVPEFSFALRFGFCVAGFALGGVCLKRFADNGQNIDLAVSLAAYLAANLAFIEILRRGLGTGMVLSSMGQLTLMVTLGALFFGERFGIMQGAGIVFALLAIAAFSFTGEPR